MRWSFGTPETHPAQFRGSSRRPGIVPAGIDRRRGAQVSAPAEAGGDSAQENRRQVPVVLPQSVFLDRYRRGCFDRGKDGNAVRAAFSADAASKTRSDRSVGKSYRREGRNSEAVYRRPESQCAASEFGYAEI